MIVTYTKNILILLFGKIFFVILSLEKVFFMLNSLLNNRIKISPRQFRFGVFLLLFCWAWAGYSQSVTNGWTRYFIRNGLIQAGHTRIIPINDISVNSENSTRYPFAAGGRFGGPAELVEYTKGPATAAEAGWYYFVISGDDGYKISKTLGATQTDIVTARETWGGNLGRCRISLVYLNVGESLKITHNNRGNRNHPYALNITNFSKLSEPAIGVGACSNNGIPLTHNATMPPASNMAHFTPDMHPENRNNCIWEETITLLTYWRVKKITKNGVCGTEEKRILTDNISNAFDSVKQLCPDDPYGRYEIRVEYEYNNGVDTQSLFSSTQTFIVPELKTPPVVSECAKSLKTASWDTATNSVKTSADKVEIEKSKLNITIEDALACCPMSWYITEKGSTTKLFEGTGQPSTSTQKIELADSDTQEKKYTITYTLGCSGQTKSENITIRPRPKVEIQ